MPPTQQQNAYSNDTRDVGVSSAMSDAIVEVRSVVSAVMNRPLRPPRHVLSTAVFQALREHSDATIAALDLRQLYPVHRPLFTELLDAPMTNLLSALQPFLITPSGPDDAVPFVSTDALKVWMAKRESAVSFALDLGDAPSISVNVAAKRHAQFQEVYSSVTATLNDTLRAYNRAMFPQTDASVPCDCDYCSGSDESDYPDETALPSRVDQCAAVLSVAESLDDDYTPWFEQPAIVDTVIDTMHAIARAFMNYASLVFHCRDIFTFSRHEQYTLLAHIVLQLQFTSLADYVLNMPCFTFCQQDLLLIALAAGMHTPRPTIFRNLCTRGLLPVDLVVSAHMLKLNELFDGGSRLSAQERTDRDACIEYATQIRSTRAFHVLGDQMHSLLETLQADNDDIGNQLWKDGHLDTTASHWTRLENDPGASLARYKYVTREQTLERLHRKHQLPLVLGKLRADLHGLTFVNAVGDAIAAPLFVVGRTDRLDKRTLDTTSLNALYITGQLFGGHKRDLMQPRLYPEQSRVPFSNFVCMDHSKEVDAQTRANAMQKFYCNHPW